MTDCLQQIEVRERRDGERGAVLVIVLLVIAALSLQVGVLTVQTVDGARLVQNAMRSARGQALMHAAVELAVAHLSAPQGRDRWSPDGQPRGVSIDGVEVVISIGDERGRVNLNAAEPLLIAGLLRQVTGDERRSVELADRIADWRDADQDRRDRGAEDRDYRRGGKPWGSADTTFTDPADVVRVLGFDEDLARRIEPYVTIWSNDARINPARASDVVRRAAKPGDGSAFGGGGSFAADAGRAAAGAAGGAAVAQDADRYVSAGEGPSYRITVAIGAPAGPVSGVAVVILGLDRKAPYRVLSWRYGYSDGANGQTGGAVW